MRGAGLGELEMGSECSNLQLKGEESSEDLMHAMYFKVANRMDHILLILLTRNFKVNQKNLPQEMYKKLKYKINFKLSYIS